MKNKAYEELNAMNQNITRLKSVFKQDIHESLEHFFSTGNLGKFQFNINLPTGEGESLGNSSSYSNSGSSSKLQGIQMNLQTFLHVSFNESIYGCTKTIQFKRAIQCTHCNDISTNSTTEPNVPCAHCNGTKRNVITSTIQVDIPPGVANKSKKVLEGLGDESENGATGDFIIIFDVEENEFYKREGFNCLCQVSIPFPHAALGTKLQIPSLYDKILYIPVEPGTSNGTIIKIENQGFFDVANQKNGDMLIQINIEMPTQLTEEEKSLLFKLTSSPNFKAKPITVKK